MCFKVNLLHNCCRRWVTEQLPVSSFMPVLKCVLSNLFYKVCRPFLPIHSATNVFFRNIMSWHETEWWLIAFHTYRTLLRKEEKRQYCFWRKTFKSNLMMLGPNIFYWGQQPFSSANKYESRIWGISLNLFMLSVEPLIFWVSFFS